MLKWLLAELVLLCLFALTWWLGGIALRVLRETRAPIGPYALLVTAGFILGWFCEHHPATRKPCATCYILAVLYVLYFWITRKLWPRFKRKMKTSSELTAVGLAQLRRQMKEANS